MRAHLQLPPERLNEMEQLNRSSIDNILILQMILRTQLQPEETFRTLLNSEFTGSR